ncbi:MAG: alpha-amylase family glycosyl hydrolase [Brevefilum sp.]
MTRTSFDPTADHIFGDLDKPENGVKWLNERYQGVHHYQQKTPANPKPDESVHLWVTCSADLPVESVYLWLTTDDWSSQTERRFTEGNTVWKTELWSYLQEWEIILAPQPPGTMLRYKIAAKLQGSDRMVFADNQAEKFQTGTHFSIWFSENKGPLWAQDTIVYQVFVDRFNPGSNREWPVHDDLRKRFGGTLRGVIEKLPFFVEMGFNALWLTPIFTSPSHHGYDISDYYHINSNFGTLDDFKELLKKAHKLKIKIILDFVANHCSSQHPFFLDAVKNQNSPYLDYFVWKEWPDYECFYNVRGMPKLNLAYGSPARQNLLDCAQHWLRLGVDGFRMDYAHGPEGDFWVDFRRACEEVKPECWTFGEIVQPADVQATYANGLGGALDFLITQAIRLTFAQRTWALSKFGAFLTSHFSYFPQGFSLPAFIDNHDMNRFLFAAQGDEQVLRTALLVLYSLPEPPIIYYGTEVPLSQYRSIHAKGAQGFDEVRLPMPWKEVESSTLPAYLATLAEIRNNNPLIRQTEWEVYAVDDVKETLVLGKGLQESFYLLINNSAEERDFSIRINQAGGYQDLILGKFCERTNNSLELSLQPFSSALLAAER